MKKWLGLITICFVLMGCSSWTVGGSKNIYPSKTAYLVICSDYGACANDARTNCSSTGNSFIELDWARAPNSDVGALVYTCTKSE